MLRPRSGSGQRGAGRARRGPGLGSSLSSAAPRGSGAGAGAGPDPTVVRSPTSPEHVLRAPDLHRLRPPAAGRGLRARAQRARCCAPGSSLPAPGGGARAAGAGAGPGALRHRPLACCWATRVLAAKNRDAGLSCSRGWGICAAAGRCAESTRCKCRDGRRGTNAHRSGCPSSPKALSSQPGSTVGKYKEK